MRFRKKIILSFSIVVFIISLFFGVFYYTHSVRNLVDATKKDVNYMTEQMCGNLSDMIESMKHASDYLLSSDDMLNAMKILEVYHREGKDVEWEETIATLKRGIYIDYFNQNFYRVIYFNEVGDVISSTNTSDKTINKNKDITEITWLKEAAKRKGKVMLLAPHEDDWAIKTNTNEIISVVRKVQGGDYGYIEVQQTVESIKEKFLQSAENMQMLAILNDKDILFASDGIKDIETLMEYAENAKPHEASELTVDSEKMIVSATKDETYGISVVLVKNIDVHRQNMKVLIPMSILLILSFCIVGISVVVVISGKITAPIRQLREQMEHTAYENLEENMQETALVLDTTADDVVALGKAYQSLLNRLNAAVVKEKKLSLLQLQAQFDTLQAQVNPHFIYNVLNVISNRGIVSGDEQICEICGSLAAMLRYSTSTLERSATIREELMYLEKYIYLLKSRYEHKLEFQCTCEKEILEETVPKIVLQQLVENSIQHGFNNGLSVMKIKVEGFHKESGWYFKVQDNGQGIAEDVVSELEKKIQKIREKILMKHSNIEMEIGGMGLANIYARMFLIYGDRTLFKIQNLEEGVVFIIGVLEKSEAFSIRADGFYENKEI